MTFENNLDADETQKIVRPHLRSKLLNIHIYIGEILDENIFFLQILKERKN